MESFLHGGDLMLVSSLAFFAAILGSREWQDQWFLYTFFILISTSIFFVAPKLGRTAAVFFFYCLASASYAWLWRHNRYFNVEPNGQMALRHFAADAAIKLLLIVIPLLAIVKNRRQYMGFGKAAAVMFIILNIGFQFFQAFRELDIYGSLCARENVCGGALGNPSLSIGFMVCLLPIALKECTRSGKIFIYVMSAISVFLSKSSIAIGLFAIVSFIYGIMSFWPLLVMAPIALFAGKAAIGSVFLSSGNRFEMWKFFMEKWFSNQANWLFGMGYGTFGVFARHIQRGLKDIGDGRVERWWPAMKEEHWWVWMHNDWLEIIFNTGVVGILLALAVYYKGARGYYVRREWPELQTFLLFGILMGCNYPTHVHIPAFFGGWLLIGGLVKSHDALQG